RPPPSTALPFFRLVPPARQGIMQTDQGGIPMATSQPLDPYSELEQAIDRVVESYDGRHEIDSLESAALPNRRAVVEALGHLKPAIYLGFYSRKPLTRSTLRFAISEHAYPAFDLL